MSTRHTIVEVDGVVKGKGPQSQVGFLWPVDSGMQHHSSGALDDRLDGSLRYRVSLVRSNAGESNCLSSIVEFFEKVLGLEDAIVAMVSFHFVSTGGGITLERSLGSHGVGGSEGGLVTEVNLPTVVVDKDSPANKLYGGVLFSLSVEAPSMDLGLVLVNDALS